VKLQKTPRSSYYKWLKHIPSLREQYGNGHKAYLSAIFDLHDNTVVSYVLGHSNNNHLVFQTLNEIKVVAMNHKDARWYSGAGIYRNTKLIVGNLVHVAIDGVKVSTPDINSERAVVTVATVIENDFLHTRTVSV
jgi:beta-galactosidase